MENKERQIAKEYILNTDRSLFLTGKAGTGKTTLLKEVLSETDKNYIVAAPTGVAAINAGGVTLHSLFLFPLRAFIPQPNPSLSMDLFCDYSGLVKHQKFDRAKLDLFIELEMLVIDEISMVRADLLDAIDFTLRRVRKNQQPFGGVQLLVIGDLYQLSPVVRHNIKLGLAEYYAGPYFFDALSWQRLDGLIIELNKVYRQEDQDFVDMLNVVRAGVRDESVIQKINARYQTDIDLDGVITLTTHNNQANEINDKQLAALETESRELSADVTGTFPESAFPTPASIELKEGAQVMFVRNHSEGLYYNGKIGVVTKIADNHIKIKGADDDKTILVEPVEWTNSRYEVDEATDKIIKNDVGSFTQYPLRLAWAVTVHKSQGLTFDQVILDLEKTFASGQLYVALSRCRSLEGMFLLSKIKPDNILTDRRIVKYYEQAQEIEEAIQQLPEAKATYERKRILKSFRVEILASYIDGWQETLLEKNVPGKANCLNLIKDLDSELSSIELVSRNFNAKMTAYFRNEQVDKVFVRERISKAVGYFSENLHEKVLLPLVKHQAEYSVKKNTKTYLYSVQAFEQALTKFLTKLYDIKYLGETVYKGEKKKLGEIKPLKKKKEKGSTYEITYAMHKEGKSINAIAKDRGMAVGTIETHLARLIRDQRVSIYDLMKDSKVEKALAVVDANPDLGLTDLIKKMPFKMTFGELRWVKNYSELLSE